MAAKKYPEDKTMAKTVEELQSELEGAFSSIEAMNAKNSELLGELKTERKANRSKDVTSEEYYKLKDQHDELQDSFNKLEHTQKGSLKDIEKLTATNDGLNATNTKLIIDDGLSLALRGLERFDIREGGEAVAIRTLKEMNPTIVDGKAMFGDKPAIEFIGEWANSDASKFYLKSKENSGGGAGGGGGQGGNNEAKYFDKKSPDFNLTKQGEILKTNPELYNQLIK